VRALALFAVASVAPLTDDFRDVEAGFKKAWAAPSAATAETRAAAVNSLEAFDDERIVALCVDALEACEKRLEALAKELASIDPEWTSLQNRDLSKEEWERHDALMERRAEIAEESAGESGIEERVVRLLGSREGSAVAASLARAGAKHRSWRIRVLALRAIGESISGVAAESLVSALSDPDSRVRIAAADGIRERGATTPFDSLVRVLATEKEWAVKVAIVSALARLKGAKSVGPLVSALAREEGRVREEIAAALETITGQRFGTDPRPWHDWYKKNAAEEDTILAALPRPSSAKPARGFTYQGIETTSRGIVFVLDISDSMNDAAAAAELPAEGVPDRSGEKRSKIDIMRDELVAAIRALDEKALFNVILYNHQVKPWQGKLVAANSSNKNLALSFLLTERASGGTNIFDALETAFTLAGIGATDKNYRSAVDTMFLVSDGAPSAGRVQDPGQIVEEIARINSLRKVKIHTVGVGVLHDRVFLERLARDNGGKYVARL